MTSFSKDLIRFVFILQILMIYCSQLVRGQIKFPNNTGPTLYINSNEKVEELLNNEKKELTNITFAHITHISMDEPSVNLLLGLTELKYVKIIENAFSTIPSGFFNNLTNIEFLGIIFNNNLNSLPVDLLNNLINLRELEISGSKIEEFSVNSFKGLTNLKNLQLLYNRITSLDDGIFNDLKNLETLSLHGNKLEQISPNLLKKLVNLKFILISDNNLKSLPDRLFSNFLYLKRVQLNINKIEELGANLFNGSVNIQRIDFSYNKLKSIARGYFNNLPNLKKLDLSKNQLEDIPEDLLVPRKGLNVSLTDLDSEDKPVMDFSTIFQNKYQVV